MTITTKTVDYAQAGQTYEGYLAMPAATPKAVIVVAHAWGGLSEFEREKTEMLAGWGYAAFAMDVYGKGNRGTTPEENEALMTPLATNRAELQSRLANSLNVAKAESGASRAAAIGFCFGGMAVLDMARTNMAIEGAASFHGLFTAPGNTAETIKPKVLALHGYDDPMAKPEDMIALTTEMTKANADWQVHAYGGTSHAFTNPAAQLPDMGMQFSETANRRSFAACKDFLEELLG